MIEGLCVGGSLELACMADLRICGELRSGYAKLRLCYAKVARSLGLLA